MPIEPPVASPRSLADAYAARPDGPAPPTAGYRRLVAARVLHRLIRQAGGW